jgi:hypothetical protein
MHMDPLYLSVERLAMTTKITPHCRTNMLQLRSPCGSFRKLDCQCITEPEDEALAARRVQRHNQVSTNPPECRTLTAPSRILHALHYALLMPRWRKLHYAVSLLTFERCFE